MEDALDALEHQIARLRQEVRRAAASRDPARVRELRAELRRAERAWDTLISPPDPDDQPEVSAPVLPVREQVHQALTLLGVPASPKLVGAVHEAFFGGTLNSSRLSSLRRDEERSYRSSPGARPYYLCPALTHDLLAPARGLVTVSTWPLEDRVVGPLSPRVHFLTAAISIADAVTALPAGGGGTPSGRLLRQFAVNIPRASASARDPADPLLVRDAARAELAIHQESDRGTRNATAKRARKQLDDAERLFGTRLTAIRGIAGQR